MSLLNGRVTIAFLIGLAAAGLRAADGVWTSMAGGDWSDPANWQAGGVAGGAGAVAYMTNVPTASQVINVPAEGVTLGKLVYAPHGTLFQTRFLGGPFIFSSDSPEIFSDAWLSIFYNDLQSPNGLIWRGGVLGTDTSYTGPTTLRESFIYSYMHLGALSQASSISNYLSTGPLVFDGGSLVVSGRGNSFSHAAEWNLTAGDTLVRKVATPLGASPGATVTGDGIPAGTFVKHNIDAETFELSQPATTSGTSTLTFGAVSGSYSHQSFERIHVGANGKLEVKNNDGTLTRVEAGELTGGAFMLTKAGDGTLTLVGENSFAGTLNLDGGTFEVHPTNNIAPMFTNVVMTSRTTLAIPDPATTATVHTVSGAGELVKTGSGALALEWVCGANTKVTVEEGTVAFTPPDIPSSVPVEGAWFHADASDPASLTIVPENGTNFVTKWNDTRNNGIFAAAIDGKARPYLREAFQNGRNVVDFGSFSYPGLDIVGHGGCLAWNQACATIREAFLVFSDTPDCKDLPDTMAWSFLLSDMADNYHFHRGINGAWFIDTYSSPDLRYGVKKLDGALVPSFLDLIPEGFHVLSMASSANVKASSFANDRNLAFGGQRLAEVLIYDKVLTDVQRRDTEAYLIKKWHGYDAALASLKLNGDGVFTIDAGEHLRVGVLEIGGNIVKEGAGTLTAGEIRDSGGSLTVAEGSVTLAASPDSAASRLKAMTFTNDATLSIEGPSTSLTLGQLAAAGSLTKSGAGTLSVGVLGSGVEWIQVGEGSMSVSGNNLGSWLHVDASDPASLTLAPENGTNFVTQWKDTRDNGIVAASIDGKARPYLREAFQNGRNVIDFGSFSYPNDPFNIVGHGGCLAWNQACETIREAFLVFSDTPDCKNLPGNLTWPFLLSAIDVGYTYDFHRGFNGAWFIDPYASAYLRDGIKWIDGAIASSSDLIPEGFHVINLTPTGPVRASAFANDRNMGFGGQLLAEVLIYDNALSETVREGIRSHLMGKWKGVARWFEGLRVASESTLSITDGVLAVGALEGGGSVSAESLSVAAVSAGDVAGEIGTLSVSGVLELPDGAVVTVDCAPPECDRIDVAGTLRLMGNGTFAVNCPTSGFGAQSLVLFTFSVLEGAEHLTEWSATGEICSRYSVDARIEDNQLILDLKGRGIVFLIQ